MGANGCQQEVEDLAASFIRELEEERIADYCRAFDAEENRRLEENGYWRSIRGRSLESFGLEETKDEEL